MPAETRPRTFESFVMPETLDIHKKYVAVPSDEPREGWPRLQVEVFRNSPDGSREKVFEYHRNYSFYNTFEPFQQLRDGEWKDYALISTEYTRFEVVDPQRGEIIATEPYPQVDEEQHKWYDERFSAEKAAEQKKENPIGMEIPGAGFCPTDFYVPTLLQQLQEWTDDEHFDNEQKLREVVELGFSPRENEWHHYLDEKNLHLFTGQYAFYCGCVWGDDTSWKLNWIDLSRIHEGIVTSDQKRYGYIPLAFGKGERLKEVINVTDEGFLQVPTLLSGHVKSPGFWEENTVWRKE